MRIDYGPGYRLYLTRRRRILVGMLCEAISPRRNVIFVAPFAFQLNLEK